MKGYVCSECMNIAKIDDAWGYSGCTYFALTGMPNSMYNGDDNY